MKLLQAEWKQPASTSKQQPSIMDLVHLAVNQQKPAVAATLIDFVKEQCKQLKSQVQLREQQAAQQQKLQPQRRMATRNRARSEQQQHDLAQQLQHLQQRLQEFHAGARGRELVHLLATAVARGNVQATGQLCSLPTAQQLPGDDILQLLHRSIVHRSPGLRITTRLLQLAATADAAVEAAATAAAVAEQDGDDAGGKGCVDQQQRQPQHKQEQRQQLLSGPAAQPQLLRLLTAAVTRGNYPAAVLLAEQPALQALDAAACSSLARTAVEQRDGAMLDALLKLPGVQAMPVHDVEQLLAVAVHSRSRYIMRQLASLPEAAAVSPASVAAMLAGLLQPDGATVADVLLALPAAQGISSEGVAALAEAALAAATPALASSYMHLVCSLPAAHHLAPPALAGLLATAVQVDSTPGPHVSNGSVAQLCALTPAALGLEASDVSQLLQAAVELGNPAVISLLCQLPAASQMQADDFHPVLQAAVSARRPANSGIMAILCRSLEAAAHQLQPQQVLQLLTEAVHEVNATGEAGVVRELLQLPAAQNLQPQDVSALVTLALQTNPTGYLFNVLLASLPAAKQMDAAQVAGLVRTAITMDRSFHAVTMLELTPADALDADSIAALLLTLARRRTVYVRVTTAASVLDLLCALPAAQQMQPQRLMQVLQESLRMLAWLQQQQQGSSDAGSSPCLVCLRKLLALQPAAQVSAAGVEQLLRQALQQMPAAVPLLCQLQGAQQLAPAAAQRLLAAAVASAAVPAQQRGSVDGPASSSNSNSQQALAVSALCKLPGAQELQPEAFAVLLRSALQHGRTDLLKCLASSGAPAERVPKGVLLELLRIAVQRMTGKVGAACLLLSSMPLLDLMWRAESHYVSW